MRSPMSKNGILNAVWNNRAAFTKEQVSNIVSLTCDGHTAEAERELASILTVKNEVVN